MATADSARNTNSHKSQVQMQNGPVQGRSVSGGESDSDLLVYMSLGKDDVAASRAAWEEFYSRHATYLYAVCLRAYGAFLGGEPGVCDLVADTFRRAYEHAGSFDDGGITDPERQRLRARAWLGRIAQRLVQSTLRGQSRVPTCFLGQDGWQSVIEARPRAAEAPAQAEQVREALMSLSEREQLILRVTLQWYRPGEEHQRLPNEVAADLARTLQTTAENLRQIRRRALRKVESLLREREVQLKKRDLHEE
jgi:DNA-directed RNA polymerase specialized sigma24 family protein